MKTREEAEKYIEEMIANTEFKDPEEGAKLFRNMYMKEWEEDRKVYERKEKDTIDYSMERAKVDTKDNKVKDWDSLSPLFKAFLTIEAFISGETIDKTTKQERLDIVAERAEEIIPELQEENMQAGLSVGETNNRLNAYTRALQEEGLYDLFTENEVLEYVESKQEDPHDTFTHS